MHYACMYADCMPKNLQIRNVPEDLHGLLKSRAALIGISLSEYLILELRVAADRPSVIELRERLGGRATVGADVDPTAALRAERDRR